MPKLRPRSSQVYSSVEDFARDIGISRKSAYAGIKEGTIPSLRVGKRIILPKALISAWLSRAPNQAA